jgi:hypothetical protein
MMTQERTRRYRLTRGVARGCVQRVVSWLKASIPIHSWEETRWNAYGIGIEERCRICGAYRHHYFEHLKNGLGNPPDWQPGRHKNKDWHEPATQK